jgi:hypothetical protein
MGIRGRSGVSAAGPSLARNLWRPVGAVKGASEKKTKARPGRPGLGWRDRTAGGPRIETQGVGGAPSTAGREFPLPYLEMESEYETPLVKSARGAPPPPAAESGWRPAGNAVAGPPGKLPATRRHGTNIGPLFQRCGHEAMPPVVGSQPALDTRPHRGFPRDLNLLDLLFPVVDDGAPGASQPSTSAAVHGSGFKTSPMGPIRSVGRSVPILEIQAYPLGLNLAAALT